MKYLGPKSDPEDLATQGDVTGGGGAPLSNSAPDVITPDQAGAAGTSTDAARADHSHEINAAAPATTLSATTTNAEGNATSFARSNHTHAISTGTPGTIQPDATAATGSASSLARSDHTHAIVAAAPSSNLTATTTNAEGSSTSFSRADHSHAITTGTPGTIEPDASAATGTSASLARADHVHAIAAGAAGTITGTNAEGTSTSFARSDHDHAYGALSIPNSALALGPTYETSLPGSPVDGQEIYYAADAANSIIWHLRYRSAARSNNGAWEFVGGAPLYDAVDTFQSTSTTFPLNHNTLQDLATVGPDVTVPLKGLYTCQGFAQTRSPGSGNFAAVHLVVGGSDQGEIAVNANLGDGAIAIGGAKQITVSSTATVVKLQYRSFSDLQSSFERRRLIVTPVYVHA